MTDEKNFHFEILHPRYFLERRCKFCHMPRSAVTIVIKIIILKTCYYLTLRNREPATMIQRILTSVRQNELIAITAHSLCILALSK